MFGSRWRERRDNRKAAEQQLRAIKLARWQLWVAWLALIATVALGIVGVLFSRPGTESTADPPAGADQRQVPLTVAVTVLNDTNYCIEERIVPKEPGDIEFSAHSEGPWEDHPGIDGSISAGSTSVEATVQGVTNAEVVLTDLEIVVEARREAPAGTNLYNPCGDAKAFRWLNVDLDEDPPSMSAEFREEIGDLFPDMPEDRRVPIQFPYEVSLTDAETFMIVADAWTCDCDWWAILSWQSEGRSGELTIDDGGEPFRTVGTGNAATRCTFNGSCWANERPAGG